MPSDSNSQKRTPAPRTPWGKVAVGAVMLLAVAYMVGQPTLERWLGIELPTIAGDNGNVAPQHERSDDGNLDRPDAPNGTFSKSPAPNRSTPKHAAPNSGIGGEFSMRSIGRGRFETAAGLHYTRHQIDHVMRHAIDRPHRDGSHGVFDVKSEKEVLHLIDQAYSMRHRVRRNVSIRKEDDRTIYTVDFGRRIGYEGGMRGNRNGKRPCNFVRLVVEGDDVITAYPTRR